MLAYASIGLAAGLILDLIFGDPERLGHPVILMGRLISFLEGRLRLLFPESPRGKRWAGRAMVFVMCVVSTAVPLLILIAAFGIHKWLGVAISTYMCWRMLALRSLRDESMNVFRALTEGTAEDARNAVSRIVGRDTGKLDETGVTKAAVETVAENFSDGVCAPMFYMITGGPVLMWLYKAVNTMDSMVGYKNERYIDFGRAAARLDDAANYIPARLAALAMIGCAGLSGLDRRDSFRIWRRDRRNHASPNAAQTESAAAGALGVQLAGDASYFGELYEKPTIGDPVRPIEPEDIPRTNRLITAATFACAAVFIAIHTLFWWVLMV